MLANCLAVGVVLAVAKRRGPVRPHLHRPLQAVAAVLAACTLMLVARAGWVQVLRADAFATASSLSEQADGGVRFEYNPRLIAAARQIERGTIYDRNGLALATSRPPRLGCSRALPNLASQCRGGIDGGPLIDGVVMFSVLGDWHSRQLGSADSSFWIATATCS